MGVKLGIGLFCSQIEFWLCTEQADEAHCGGLTEFSTRLRELKSGWREIARCWSSLRLIRYPNGRVHDEKQVKKKNGDQDEPPDKDVRSESEHSSMVGKVRWRNVSVLVIVFVHAYSFDANATMHCDAGRGTAAIWQALILVKQMSRNPRTISSIRDGPRCGCYGKKQ